MNRSSANLEDIADSIAALASMVAEQFTQIAEQFIRVDQRFNGIEERLTSLEVGQRTTNQRLEHLEDETEALRNDVRELYLLSSA